MLRTLVIFIIGASFTICVHAKRYLAHYALSNNNKALVVIGKGKQKKYSLGVPRGTQWTKAIAVETKSILVYMFEYSDEFNAGSRILVFNKRNLKKMWEKDLHGFNLTKPLIHKGSLYFSTLGSVYKYNLYSGKPIWEHQGLLPSHNFTSSEKISIQNDIIHFSDSVLVDDKTGELVRSKK